MSTWRAKVSEFFQKWRYARYRVKAARADLQDEREAAELERARKGVNRFPTTSGRKRGRMTMVQHDRRWA